PHDVLEEYALARAGRPEHQRDLSLGDVAGDVLEDGLRAEGLGQLLDRDFDVELSVALTVPAGPSLLPPPFFVYSGFRPGHGVPLEVGRSCDARATQSISPI